MTGLFIGITQPWPFTVLYRRSSHYDKPQLTKNFKYYRIRHYTIKGFFPYKEKIDTIPQDLTFLAIIFVIIMMTLVLKYHHQHCTDCTGPYPSS